MINLFKRKQKALDETGDGLDASSLDNNDAAAKRQKLLLYGGGGAAGIAAMAWILAPSAQVKKGEEDANAPTEITVKTDDMVNRNMSEKEWMALSEGQMQGYDNRLKGVEGQQGQIQQLEAQIQTLQGEKSAMVDDGSRVVTAYEQQNAQLKAELAAAKAAPPPMATGPSALYGAGAPSTYRTPGASGTGAIPSGSPLGPASEIRSNEIKLVTFGGDSTGTANRIERGKATSYTDSPNYLPPNSMATAKVIVGVDAATSVKTQSDPLPVVLRITGPARSVFSNGKLLRTNIEGCMVNGAAQGDLSSEKVYVKLQRMTCPQPGGRFAVSEVKGFVSFGGKTGVRGRVVSREGGLIGQAFLAGLAGGFGRGFSANTNSVLTGTNVTVNGKRQQLGLGEIAQGGLGEGISTSADTISKYLIERAEQYQPVVEMPTGIDVEIIFLDGVFIRN